jgi:2-iminobutanoate/2-iminopropanoate deaminase
MADEAMRIMHHPHPSDLPLSASVQIGRTLFLSGQVARVEPGTELRDEVVAAMNSLVAALKQANATLIDVVKTSVYMVDPNDFPLVNEVYGQYFTEDFPARTTTVVGLVPPFRFEIDAVALISRSLRG